MAAYVQMSGFHADGFFENVIGRIRPCIPDRREIVFVASRPDMYEKNDDRASRIFRWFTEAGAGFERYGVIDNRTEAGEQRRMAECAPCIYLLGGQTRNQRAYIDSQGLFPVLKKHGGTIIGLSAGAINLSHRSMIANPSRSPFSMHEGIGLVNTTVVPHFENLSCEYIETWIFPQTTEKPVYGLCEDAVIVTQNGTVCHSGEIYRVYRNTLHRLEDGEEILT